MAKYRLKDNHPDLEKFNKLIDLAIELDITLHFDGGECSVHIGDNQYFVEDIEPDQYVFDFPNPTETKLTYES